MGIEPPLWMDGAGGGVMMMVFMRLSWSIIRIVDI